MFPVLQNEIVMLKTPNGVFSLFEFYNKFLNKDIDSSTNKLISSQKRNAQHFIFSAKQLDLDQENDENSRSINSQFEVNEDGIDDQDKIEFQIDDCKRDTKVSFLESIDFDDSYIHSKNKIEKSPEDCNLITNSDEKKNILNSKDSQNLITNSPLMTKKEAKIPPNSMKIPKKTKSRLADLVLKNEKANQNLH